MEQLFIVRRIFFPAGPSAYGDVETLFVRLSGSWLGRMRDAPRVVPLGSCQVLWAVVALASLASALLASAWAVS